MIKRECFLMAGTGQGGCPIPVEPPQWCDLKGWSQSAAASSPCLHGDITMLVYFIPLLRGFVKKHLQML